MPPELLPWTGYTVRPALVAVFADQLCLNPEDVLPDAEIPRDLGVD